MCDLYASADPIHYEQRTRSLRIRGVVTSIRLENLCWDVLARIAAKDQVTTNQLISTLYEEIIGRQGKIDNLSSFLRITCMRYLSLVAEQHEKQHLMLGAADRTVNRQGAHLQAVIGKKHNQRMRIFSS